MRHEFHVTTTALWTFKLESKAKTPSLVTPFGDSYSYIKKGIIIKKRNIIYVSYSKKTCSCKIFIKDWCIIFSYIYCTLYYLLQMTLYPTVISLIQFNNLLDTLLLVSTNFNTWLLLYKLSRMQAKLTFLRNAIINRAINCVEWLVIYARCFLLVFLRLYTLKCTQTIKEAPILNNLHRMHGNLGSPSLGNY